MSLETESAQRARRRAALLGASAGLRSQAPIVVLIRAVGEGRLQIDRGEVDRWMRDPRVQLAATAAAIGELVADKLPFIPARIKPGQFAGRLLYGGIAGALGARSSGASLRSGALLGGAAAGVSATAGVTYRTIMPALTRLPSFVVALAEDALAYYAACDAISPNHLGNAELIGSAQTNFA